MLNQEILGGLRHAINRGESLEKAMLSFYNAGYRKEEIEEAAKFILSGEVPVSVVKEEQKTYPKEGHKGNFLTNSAPDPARIDEDKFASRSRSPKRGQVEETKLIPAQINQQSKISAYGQEKLNPVKRAARGLIIAIVVVAILFVGLLIAFLITT